jgi:hypothetical protein
LGLEIELEDDDDAATEGWARPGESELRERSGWFGPVGPARGRPLLLHLGVALAALAVGAASTAGFLDGQVAERGRGIAMLNLAAVTPFVVEPLQEPDTPTVAQLLATPWTNTFEQNVTLSVVDDGPDPVTVLGATLVAPEFTATRLTSRDGAPTAPGGVSVLRGTAQFRCGDFPAGAPGGPLDAAAAVATVADLSVRTADGAVRRQILIVDHYSETAEQAVCARMPDPQVLTSTSYAPSATAGAYTVTVTVADRAPFPLLMTLPTGVLDDWSRGAGLDIQVPPPSIVAPHGSATMRIRVDVTGCVSALVAARGRYAFNTLYLTDARISPDSSRQSNQSVALADPDVIEQYCGSLEQPGVGSGR